MNSERAFVPIEPAHHVRPYVEQYWFCREDRATPFRPVLNCPLPRPYLALRIRGEILVNEQRLSAKMTFSGVQTFSRPTQGYQGYYALLAPLTIAGTVRLFPALGGLANRVAEFGDLWGDKLPRELHNAAVFAWEPRRVAEVVDAWLTRRLQQVRQPREAPRFLAAYQHLCRGCSLEVAARHVDVSARQLERWFVSHLGIGPKRVMRLERLQQSLWAIRVGGDPLKGYSDQSHQIRDFRTYLHITPQQYGREILRVQHTYAELASSLYPQRLTIFASEL